MTSTKIKVFKNENQKQPLNKRNTQLMLKKITLLS